MLGESQSVPAAHTASGDGLALGAEPVSLAAIDEDEEDDVGAGVGAGEGGQRRTSTRVPALNMKAVTKMNEKRAHLAAVYNEDIFQAFDSHGLVPAVRFAFVTIFFLSSGFS